MMPRPWISKGSCRAAMLLAWQPCKLNGDKDCFLLTVFDGADRSSAYFVRREAHASEYHEFPGLLSHVNVMPQAVVAM